MPRRSSNNRAISAVSRALFVCSSIPRVSTAGRASSSRATCRACKEAIPKDTWRIALVFYDDGRFVPSGFIHAGCTRSYIETTDIMDRVKHFSPDLSASDLEDLRAAILSPG